MTKRSKSQLSGNHQTNQLETTVKANLTPGKAAKKETKTKARPSLSIQKKTKQQNAFNTNSKKKQCTKNSCQIRKQARQTQRRSQTLSNAPEKTPLKNSSKHTSFAALDDLTMTQTERDDERWAD